MAKRFPWGVFFWIFVEIAFFLTLGVVVAYLILNAIAGATSGGVTLFTNWWQTALFAGDVVAVLGCLFCFVKYIGAKKNAKRKSRGSRKR